MKTEKIIIEYPVDKLQAIRVSKPEAYKSIEKTLMECIDKIYAKSVSLPIRQYIEACIIDEEMHSKNVSEISDLHKE